MKTEGTSFKAVNLSQIILLGKTTLKRSASKKPTIAGPFNSNYDKLLYDFISIISFCPHYSPGREAVFKRRKKTEES